MSKHVDGKNKDLLTLYVLSTCIWCRKVKDLLNTLGVAYDYIDVDTLEGDQRQKTVDEIRKWNPACSFPTLVINNKKCIVGYNETKIKEALK
ncbi:MAG: glutaredoxin family protein [Planctomycetes bacterium]|nr:glutaredoxin family protein [Planctomycetota bacterium]